MRARHVVLRSACVMGAVVALTRPVGEPARVTAVARGGAVITGLNGKPPLSAIDAARHAATPSEAAKEAAEAVVKMHQRVAGHDTTLGAELQRLEVFAKCRQCVASGLDERGVQRAAGQRLDPECAGAGEGIEDAGTLDGVE